MLPVHRVTLYLLCLLAVGGPFSTAVARDVFVNNMTGDNALDGSFPNVESNTSGPVRTIGRALQLADKADRIVLAKTDMPYREMISLSTSRQSGFRDHPFEIIGNGAVLDGTQPISPIDWRQVRGNVYCVPVSHPRYQQLFVDGRPALRRQLDSIATIESSLAVGQWGTLGSNTYFRTAVDKHPNEYEVRYAARQTGITLYQVQHVRISNLIVQGFRLDGVNAHDTVHEVELVDLNCRACGRSGVSVGGASRVVLRDCVLYDNGVAQLRTQGRAVVRLFNTELDPATAPAFIQAGGRLLIDDVPANES